MYLILPLVKTILKYISRLLYHVTERLTQFVVDTAKKMRKQRSAKSLIYTSLFCNKKLPLRDSVDQRKGRFMSTRNLITVD